METIDKISIIGVGKLGLCLALNLERKGFKVVGCDISENYVSKLTDKTFSSSEPMVNELLQSSKNIEFTTNLEQCISFSNIIFTMVATPSLPNKKYDHTQIELVISKLESLGRQEQRKLFIVGCTTYPGYCQTLVERLDKLNYDLLYNPEFIAQGNIIYDQLHPDMVLIGETTKESGDKLEYIHKKLCNKDVIFTRMSLTESELTKLSINCFITTKISFANMIGDIANRLNCNSDVVLNAVGSDSRIGTKYIKPGFGFGGPCFPRDNRALYTCAEELGIDAIVSKATDEMNEKHLEYQLEDFIKNNPDKEIAVKMDYITYKKDSILIEESQQLKFALKLKDLGYKVEVLDTREEVLKQIKNIL